MTEHLTRDAAARWAAGVLEDDEARRVEAHAQTCAECERLLQEEARVEVLLQTVRAPGREGPSASVGGSPEALRGAAAPEEATARGEREGLGGALRAGPGGHTSASAPEARGASGPGVVLPLRPRRTVRAGLAVAAAALAAAVAWLAFSRPALPPLPLPRLASADAGLSVPLDVPRYEEGVPVPPEALSAFAPFEL
ncbi:MAG: zf-HC2 domain-containing protein [Myxococcales bacterium]|nr:zf-HC2 domain-containing protein [Myxococcales bacterium]